MNAAFSIDSVIESFERQRSGNRSTQLSDFLPPMESADFSALLTELIRVDLEYSWNEGQPRRLEEYLKSYPQLQSDHTALSAVAYEEYRQRQQAGETPSAAEYHRLYRIDTRHWPIAIPDAETTPPDTPTGEDHPTLKHPPAISNGSLAKASHPSYFIEGGQQKLPHVGSVFLDFTLESELGQGAFGKVYLARQKGLANRPVALKITARKQHEPQTLARLRHTNIMPIYSVHEAGFCQAICMPFLGRTTLGNILAALRQEKQFPVSGAWWSLLVQGSDSVLVASEWKKLSYSEVVLSLAEKMVAGLAHAHSTGIVHRDIKPANILLSNDGEPLLLDFNLAVLLENEGSLAAMAGTLPYLAPEQLESLVKGQGTTGSKQADVYAIGLILYELLCGQSAYPPVKHDALLGYIAELAKQRRVPPPALGTLKSDISPALAAIVARCLATSPSERYADAQQLLEDLQRQRRHQPLRYAPDSSLAERWSKWNRRHPRFIRNSLLVGLALLAVTAGVIAYQRNQSEQRLYYRSQLAQSEHDLHRAEQLATVIWPTKLPEAARLIDQFLATMPVTPELLLQQPQAQYVPESDRQKLPAMIAQALLLQARIYELEAARAIRAEEQKSGHEKALASNMRAQAWCRAAGFPQLATWQQHFLSNEHVSDDVKLLLETPQDTIPARELAGLAYTLLDEQHWHEAAAITKLIVDRDPGWARGWFLHGLVYARGGQIQQALHGFETALALEPEDSITLHFRGKARLQLGDLNGALADFDRALQLDASPADVLADKALALLQKNQPKEAVAALDKALQQDNRQVRLYFMRADSKAQLGDKVGAAEDRKLGLAATPVSEHDHVTRGIALRDQKDWQGALNEFKAAEQIAPNYLAALENQSEILGEQLSKPAEALTVLNRAIERIPQSSLLFASRAVYHARLGHRNEAVKDVQSTIQLDAMPQPLTLYQIGCVYALTSKANAADAYQAIAYLSLALERQFGKQYLATDTDLDPIRARPEFKELLKLYMK